MTRELIEGYIPDMVEWQSQPESVLHDIDLLMGHQYFGNHEYLRPGAKYVTLLREPVDRTLSFYHYVERSPEHYLHDFGFEVGVPIVDVINNTGCIEFDNVQVRMLNPQPDEPPPFGEVSEEMFEIACENLRYIHNKGFVGVVERMETSLEVLERLYGWDPTRITRANASDSRPPLDSYDEASLAALREHNQFDTRLYALALELLESHVARV